ncbi:hypothetical protein ACFL6U_30450 [Planctomycetota bacterium]
MHHLLFFVRLVAHVGQDNQPMANLVGPRRHRQCAGHPQQYQTRKRAL